MDFPFDIYDVADQVGLTLKRPHIKSADYNCPFCDGIGKLNLNIEKNAYRCNKCSVYGGMLDLFCRCTNVSDRKTAYKCLTEKSNYAFAVQNREQRQSKVNAIKEVPKADIERLDFCYRAMLDELELDTSHKWNLLDRGLSEKEIQINLYKSVPVDTYNRLVPKLLNRGCDLIGVPGFFADLNGEIKVNIHNHMSGFFVPVFNEKRQIQGMQIRRDTLDKRKYMWLSSAEKMQGCSSNSPVQVSGDIFNSRAIYVTEGALKCHIAHFLSEKTFVAIAGVSQQKELETLFQRLQQKSQCKIIVDALDMDDDKNEHVRRGHINLAWLADKYGFIPKRIIWDRQYKGIDDYLLSKKNNGGILK